MASKSSSACGPAMASDTDWRAESDHRTMTDAAEIQSDKSRMSGVKKQHKKHMKKAALVQRTLMGGSR